VSEPLTDEDRAELQVCAKSSIGEDTDALGGCGQEVLRLLDERDALAAENERLKAEANQFRGASHRDREFLGKLVRSTWVEWAREQDDPKPHWLEPWEALNEPMREVDRRIGERVAGVAEALADREIERLEDEVERVRLLSQDVEREFSPMNCVDIGMALAELKRLRAAATATAPSPRLKAAIEAWRKLSEDDRNEATTDLVQCDCCPRGIAQELLDACAEPEQSLSPDGETRPETPAAKRAALPGAALLAAYPHVQTVQLRSDRYGWLRVMSDGAGQWLSGGWGDGWHENATIDDALRDAEARAAKAGDRVDE
jgi:hypothetical protein